MNVNPQREQTVNRRSVRGKFCAVNHANRRSHLLLFYFTYLQHMSTHAQCDAHAQRTHSDHCNHSISNVVACLSAVSAFSSSEQATHTHKERNKLSASVDHTTRHMKKQWFVHVTHQSYGRRPPVRYCLQYQRPVAPSRRGSWPCSLVASAKGANCAAPEASRDHTRSCATATIS